MHKGADGIEFGDSNGPDHEETIHSDLTCSETDPKTSGIDL